MSLGVGVCVCALLGAATPRVIQRYAMIVVAIVFFGFLYRDEKAINSIQDRMGGALARLSQGSGHVEANR